MADTSILTPSASGGTTEITLASGEVISGVMTNMEIIEGLITLNGKRYYQKSGGDFHREYIPKTRYEILREAKGHKKC